MAIQFWDGVILFRNGVIALDPNCCCVGVCCGWTDENAPATLTLTIEASDCTVASYIQVTLTKVTGVPGLTEYIGSFSIGGCYYNVSFLCDTSPNYPIWVLSFDLLSGPWQVEHAETSCDPFYWVCEGWFYLDPELCGPCDGEFPGASPALYTVSE